MTREFKVGDRVKAVRHSPSHPKCSYPTGNASIRLGSVGEVVSFSKNCPNELFYVRKIGEKEKYDKAYIVWIDAFDLDEPVDRIIEAKELLEKEGYTITPPKPKEKGKVYVLKGRDGGIVYVMNPCSWGDGWKIIAIVDWEEGMGMNDGDKEWG